MFDLLSAAETAASAVTSAENEGIGAGWYGVLSSGESPNITVYIIAAILCAILGYLLGSINFAVVISRVKYKDDIRNHGSGNAGATNMSRTYGKAAGAATLLGDILKTVVAVFTARILCGENVAYMTGMFCVIGHAYPCYYKFKGGKGVAVTAAMALTLEPLVFLILLLIFAMIVGFTKYVSLGSVISAMIYPMLVYNFQCMRYGHGDLRVLFAFIVCLIIVSLHKENIKRLLDGKENKFSFKKSDKK